MLRAAAATCLAVLLLSLKAAAIYSTCSKPSTSVDGTEEAELLRVASDPGVHGTQPLATEGPTIPVALELLGQGPNVVCTGNNSTESRELVTTKDNYLCVIIHYEHCIVRGI